MSCLRGRTVRVKHSCQTVAVVVVFCMFSSSAYFSSHFSSHPVLAAGFNSELTRQPAQLRNQVVSRRVIYVSIAFHVKICRTVRHAISIQPSSTNDPKEIVQPKTIFLPFTTHHCSSGVSCTERIPPSGRKQWPNVLQLKKTRLHTAPLVSPKCVEDAAVQYCLETVTATQCFLL